MKRGFLTTIILTTILFFSIDSFANKFIAKADGNWNDTSTWDCGTIPTSSDTVYIDGFLVALNTPFKVKSLFISNSSGNKSMLSISDTLIITDEFRVTAENDNADIDIVVNSSGVLNALGNVDFIRTNDNVTDGKLQFLMEGNSKTFITGDFTFDYKNASTSEPDHDIYIRDNAKLEVTGQTKLINRSGKNLDFILEGTSQVILRDSVSLLAYGGERNSITAKVNSNIQLLSNVYLLNSGGSNHTKLKTESGAVMTISGNVYMESTGAGLDLKLESRDKGSEFRVEGDIVMTSSTDQCNLIEIKEEGQLFLGGNILRPTNFGAMVMKTDGKLIFNGTEPQNMPVGKLDNSGQDSLYFGIVSMENTSGAPFELTNNLIITDSLILSAGKLKTTTSSMVVIEDGAFIKGGNSNAYVNGPILKKGASNGVTFTFPIGSEDNYAPISITPESNNSSAEYTAQYYSDPPPLGNVNGLNSISGSDYWKLEKSSGSPEADITLSWYDAASQGIQDLDDIVVAGLTSGDWVSYGNGGTTGTTGTNGSGTISSLAGDPPPLGTDFFTIGSTSAKNSLPVELISFQAIQQNDYAYLHWATASERNTSHFSIERSIDGVDFKEIGNISGSGDGEITRQYNYQDLNPQNGINYYRLKIVDHDGSFEYSNIEVVKFEESPSIQIYPNPVEKVFQINGFQQEEDKVFLEVFDRNGQLIYFRNISVNNGQLELSIDEINTQTSGTYFIRTTSTRQTHILKFIKI